MTILPELSKNTWTVLFSLTGQPSPAAKIAKENNLRLNRISEALNQLERSKILKSRGRRELLNIDTSLKSVLKDLLIHYSKDLLIELLEGKKLNTLFQILNGYDSIGKLKLITDYSIPTLKRILKKFQQKLFIYQPKKGVYKIRDEFKALFSQLYNSFFAYFLDSLESQKITWKKVMVFGNNILLQSTQISMPGFVQTGFSLFHKYKVELISTNDNYFISYKREPTKEEVFIHALTFSTRDYRYMIYCTLFADLNRLTLNKLDKLSIIYKVKNEVTAIFDFLKSKGKIRREFVPMYREYMEIRRDYAGD